MKNNTLESRNLSNQQVTLEPLLEDNREQFIRDNQRAFRYGATEEFGLRDDHFEEDGEIISRATIEASIDGEKAEVYRILLDGEKVGGAVISVDGAHGELELLFVNPEVHSKGIGYAAWCLIEALHPEVTVWETTTPYFEKRNIHFYVNRCGFHIVEFWNSHFPGPSNPEEESDKGEMFLFRKVMNQIHTPSPLRGTPPNLGGELVTNQHK